MSELAELFRFTMNPLELFIRGTLIYVGLVLVFRFMLHRDLVGLGVADVLLIALLADAAQNGMAGDYRSLADAAVLLGTLALWNAAMNFATFRWKIAARLFQAPSVELVRDGRIIRRNLRREWITVEELLTQLRSKGVTDVNDVAVATLESDGELSVLEKHGGRKPTDPGKNADAGHVGPRG